MKKGDKVKYVPDKAHSRERALNGDFPWHMGIKKHERAPLEKLSHAEFAKVLNGIKKMPEVQQKREVEKLVYIKPAQLWDATVRDIVDLPNGQQLACLDIISGTNACVTLHYDNVPVDNKCNMPHTCHDVAVTVVEPVEPEEIDNDDDEDND